MLERVGDKWTILVLAALEGRAWGFRELQRAIDGISQRMLTVTLRRLERDGLVSRTVLGTRPPRVEYALTDLGSSLTVPLRSVAEWAQANRAQITANRHEWDARG
ncbi:MAG: helix-turn-helix domain-containing protein [Microbacterium sp.]